MDGWMNDPTTASGAVDGIWCPACSPSFFSPSHGLTFITGRRSYAKQTVYDAHLSSKKHIKAAAKALGAPVSSAPTNGNGQASSSTSFSTKLRSPARLTYLIIALLVPLQSTLAETKANVERRFSLTARERETELVEDVPSTAPAPAADGTAGEIVEEPEEEEKIYNPLKLPLGWDGKPIPYWLYKLHGLGVEYRCEICSDHVYMGRKNFERHFQVRSGVTLYREEGTK
jgi:splicing factor 3A subunit 3